MTADWPHVVLLDPWTAGLAMARRMVRAGATVTMVALPGHHWETYSRGVRRAIESFGSDGAPWLQALRRIAAGGEQIVVIPATDRACELLIRGHRELPENLTMFERSAQGHLPLMDKQTADGIARGAGVHVPWTAVIETELDLERAVAQAPWPCVLKPTLSHEWRQRYGERRTFPVARAEEVVEIAQQPLRDGIPMLLSQYIPGGDDAVEEAIVVRLADGSYPVRFGCRKLRQSPPGFGVTGLGESSPLPETMEIARRVLDAANFVGVAGVEAKRDSRTGERWFLEVNVRVPGQWGLGDACGVQATPRLVASMMGAELGPQPPLRPGVRFVAPASDIDACRQLLSEVPARRRPGLAVKLFAPYLGARELGFFDLRDPGPVLAWGGTVAGRRLERLRRAVAGVDVGWRRIQD
jgi:D-aspartate ligase